MSLPKLNPVEPPWYVTRMPGGVGGAAPQGVPLSRSLPLRRPCRRAWKRGQLDGLPTFTNPVANAQIARRSRTLLPRDGEVDPKTVTRAAARFGP
jgi:hypothetical protein